jgi:hypothetical protein
MQGKPSCLTCPPPESHQPCTSDSEPRQPQTSVMAHIANCMRSDSEMSPVYITLETSSRMVSHPAPLHIAMNYHLPRRSRSLRDIQAARDSQSPTIPHSKSPSLATLHQPTASKYQLWPSAKSPVGLPKPKESSDKLAALSAGRSGTSLSDTAVLPESSLPFWQRTGSLSRRRKVSVPELGNTMTTVQEMSIDSRKCELIFTMAERWLTMSSSNDSRKASSPQAFLRSFRPREILQCSRHQLEDRTIWRCNDGLCNRSLPRPISARQRPSLL